MAKVGVAGALSRMGSTKPKAAAKPQHVVDEVTTDIVQGRRVSTSTEAQKQILQERAEKAARKIAAAEKRAKKKVLAQDKAAFDSKKSPKHGPYRVRIPLWANSHSFRNILALLQMTPREYPVRRARGTVTHEEKKESDSPQALNKEDEDTDSDDLKDDEAGSNDSESEDTDPEGDASASTSPEGDSDEMDEDEQDLHFARPTGHESKISFKVISEAPKGAVLRKEVALQAVIEPPQTSARRLQPESIEVQEDFFLSKGEDNRPPKINQSRSSAIPQADISEHQQKKHRMKGLDISPPDNDTAPAPRPKSKCGGRKKGKHRTVRPTARALGNSDTKAVLKVAAKAYRCWLSTSELYPEDDARDLAASHAWAEACHTKMFEEQEFTTKTYIVRRGSQVRCELITKARPIVKGYFGFHSGKDEADVDHNRDLVDALKSNAGYLYTIPSNKLAFARVGSFRKSSTLCVTVALVFTVIEHCIDEFSTGTQHETGFSEILCKAHQEAHVHILRKYEAFDPVNFSSILSDIYSIGLCFDVISSSRTARDSGRFRALCHCEDSEEISKWFDEGRVCGRVGQLVSWAPSYHAILRTSRAMSSMGRALSIFGFATSEYVPLNASARVLAHERSSFRRREAFLTAAGVGRTAVELEGRTDEGGKKQNPRIGVHP
ncbi:hypothetical protein PLICRDRAFT_33071 [Plicaturopsis crispa FD-325 SS-3]|uniref:Unplaced genomic scaffold PLICRscaffold_29, whole genome shotgun sequence n=1 Tax=Plicaturopsis crispa FD-325 SS-3 TaxID=944288 RepID=A0A0C9SK53_PLICR|nr:hypothetical protein PLICRDRAFT_33071 [Plicaturopsis crispa FD-325 SS-3]